MSICIVRAAVWIVSLLICYHAITLCYRHKIEAHSKQQQVDQSPAIKKISSEAASEAAATLDVTPQQVYQEEKVTETKDQTHMGEFRFVPTLTSLLVSYDK